MPPIERWCLAEINAQPRKLFHVVEPGAALGRQPKRRRQPSGGLECGPQRILGGGDFGEHIGELGVEHRLGAPHAPPGMEMGRTDLVKIDAQVVDGTAAVAERLLRPRLGIDQGELRRLGTAAVERRKLADDLEGAHTGRLERRVHDFGVPVQPGDRRSEGLDLSGRASALGPAEIQRAVDVLEHGFSCSPCDCAAPGR